jgi:hypothetical protein
MSWSLQLRNGDLALSGTNLGQVSGSEKLVQDLRGAILERMGTDDMHPWFGSLIDGGRNADGLVELGIIGETDIELAALNLQSEVRRIATQYQETQARRLENDRLTFGASTLDPSEILLSIQSIRVMQAQDRLLVTIEIQTGTGQTINLDVPVEAT